MGGETFREAGEEERWSRVGEEIGAIATPWPRRRASCFAGVAIRGLEYAGWIDGWETLFVAARARKHLADGDRDNKRRYRRFILDELKGLPILNRAVEGR